MSWGTKDVPHDKGHDASIRVRIPVEAFLFSLISNMTRNHAG